MSEKELYLELQEIDHALAGGLVTAMDKRESSCFDNDAFWAAAYLDRRINYNGTPFLTEDQQKRGMVCMHGFGSWIFKFQSTFLTGASSENMESNEQWNKRR